MHNLNRYRKHQLQKQKFGCFLYNDMQHPEQELKPKKPSGARLGEFQLWRHRPVKLGINVFV